MSKRRSNDNDGAGPSKIPKIQSQDEAIGLADDMEVGANSGGGAGSSGDMPKTNLNNPYSACVIITIPDVMTGPATLTYRQIWTAAINQHGMLREYSDPGLPMYLTPHRVDLYGASAGMLTMTPYIQRPNTGNTVIPTIIEQQIVDVGTIDRKPHLSHTYPNDGRASREVNSATVLSADDPLLSYQLVQKATTPVPVDAGYLRISFSVRPQHIINIDTGIARDTAVRASATAKELLERTQKQSAIDDKMRKISYVKKLAPPHVDQ